MDQASIFRHAVRGVVFGLLVGVFVITAAPKSIAQRKPTRRTAPARSAPAGASEEDRKAIEDLHQREIQANMAYDVNALAGLWDDDIVSLPPGQAPVLGMAANLDALKKGEESMANVEILGYTQDWREVRQVGEFAFEWGITHLRMRSPAGQKETEQNLKVLRVLKRQPEGSWKVYRTMWNELPPPQAPAQSKP